MSPSDYEAVALAAWTDLSRGTPPPSGVLSHLQRNWDKPVVASLFAQLQAMHTCDRDKARLLAVSAPKSGAWLQALPISSCGLRLDDDAIRVAVGLRLGAPLCLPHRCPCGSDVDALGGHALSCKKSSARIARHAALNDQIYRCLSKAGYHAVKEPAGLLRTDNKRPDGITQIPWAAGKCLSWDVTVCDTLALSYVSLSSVSAGSACERAASLKVAKYSNLASTFDFIPLAFETLGPLNAAGFSFLKALGRKLSAVSGESREPAFLFQRLSVTVQRFNAIALRDSFISDVVAG